MYRLRTVEGLTLAEIGKRFGVGPERVRQLINRHIHHTTGQIPNPGQISRTASEIRRQAEIARAQEHAVELLVAWRRGADIHALAREFGLRVGCVRQAIQEIVGSDDRAARTEALQENDSGRPPRP